MGKGSKAKSKIECNGKKTSGGRPPGKHADQYVFQCPGEWEHWFFTLLTDAGPGHAVLGLLRKNYGARLDGFRKLQRKDIQLGSSAKDSKIVLQPQKGWTKSKWEPMTEEVYSALRLSEKGIGVTRVVQQTPTGGTVTRHLQFTLPSAKQPSAYCFTASKRSGPSLL